MEKQLCFFYLSHGQFPAPLLVLALVKPLYAEVGFYVIETYY